ncbi:docking protein 2-like [Boleophthalmus pectinirostris]|uniref:docking protein 2-like n=1 Tax=Boleophthalmus pectinirostris TaxID=150288 RepID=UPI00242C3544|nr:docking protein 2-like [Boleophthalmus pectinirostris]
MEDDVSKKGALFLQQQRFGKRWRKIWCVLFRESHCSVSRLEIYDWNERNDKSIRKHQDSKKVIRLSSCIRVTPVDVDGSPKDTSAFLMETTEKIFVFAVDRLQVDEWTQKLCEIAFPVSWSSLPEDLRNRSDSNQNQNQGATAGMEDNSLYSQRETVLVQDFRVLVRRTEASDRCRLKGEAVLRADADALILMDRGGQVLFSWPYRYLRRFGRDKSSFSFEAGRRCDSGEGSFEFDTKQGNTLFVAVETAINRQRMSLPHRQASTGLDAPAPGPRPQRQASMGLDGHPPITRSLPPRPEVCKDPDPVYSLVNDLALQVTQKDREISSPSLRHHQCRLEPPVDKTLTAVKSLTLENRDPPVHRKSQVKMISSCPLPGDPAPSAAPGHAPSALPGPPPPPPYTQVPADRKKKSKNQGKNQGPNGSFEARRGFESEYSLPFDLVIPDLRELGGAESKRTPAADPLYDSIDEFQIRNVFHSNRPDHIYDEPEGCQSSDPDSRPLTASAVAGASLYDEPEEMRVEAWRIMGTEQDPKGHEFPYNPRVDDYAVPKRPQRAFPEPQDGPDPDLSHNQGLDRDLDQEPDLEHYQEQDEEEEEERPEEEKRAGTHGQSFSL